MNNIDQPGKPGPDTGQAIVKPPTANQSTVAVQPPATVTPPVTIGPAEETVMAARSRPDLAATVLAERARWRARGQLHSALGRLVRRRRLSWRAALAALSAEDQHVGAARDLARKTHTESLVQALGKRAADASLAKSQRRLDRKLRKAERLQARQARLRVRAEHRARDRVRHPDGGHDTAERLERAGSDLRGRITAELADGSRKHGRLPRWIRHVPQLVLVVDFSLLLYFFAGITNVDWDSPVSSSLGFAILLGLMVTTLTYGFLSFTGYRLRMYKDHSGAIALRDLDGLTRAACGAAAGGAAIIATLMFVRMRAEVLDALGSQGWVTAVVIAAVLAAVSGLANFLVILIHALDGSDEVARLDAIWANASGPLGKAHRMREKAAIMAYRLAIQQRRADRQAMGALTEAGHCLATADRFIEAARAVHQGAGPHAGQAVDPSQQDGAVGYLDDANRPAPDLRPLRMALDHVRSPLPEMPAQADDRAF
jgi:hypothetical protein